MDYSFLNNDLFINKIVLACYVESGQAKLVHTNRSSYGIAYHPIGKKSYDFDTGEKLPVDDGNIIFLPKGSNYKVNLTEGGNCYAINFLLSEDISASPFTIQIRNKADILQSFKKAESAFRKQGIGSSEQCCREIYNILYLMKKQKDKNSYISPEQKKILNTATSYIADNYTSKTITVKDLSDICSVSDTYLRYLFKSEYNLSPIDYINKLRLSYAESLLLSGEYSVSDVCFMSGFNDTSYFSRSYKKFYGIPPMKAKP